ncbi:hypothetical protein PVAND_013878 [Polypedilum vanderplanki]|uniref:Nose resistant-to-fluoxetine protein N-terminal domain-containing protein n=1 Tax=Polypedilum vanderplanki TaxID=319348 RepID=A0A9J6CRY8_POLVA|nr:hypothetical protein PVAND_013878 [Polypedilum vanderplanki]
MINLWIILCLFNGYTSSFALRLEAPEKSASDKEFINTLARKLFVEAHKNPMNISQYEVSADCRRDYLHYLQSLMSFDMWALQMYDASGHFSTGILRGNVNSFGDFEECINIRNEKLKISGKHCYIETQPHIEESAQYLNHLKKLIQSYEIIKSRLEDPAHIFTHFSSIVYGLCVPSSCTHDDVKTFSKTFLSQLTNNTGINFELQVTKEMCHVAENSLELKALNNGSKITICLFMVICLMALFSTHVSAQSKDKKRWLEAFSLSRNYKSLVSTYRTSDDVKVIHGIKFVNAIMIFLCHKTVDSLIPSVNRTKVAEKSSEASSIVVRVCALYTDVFLMLSGVLVAYSITSRLMKKQRISLIHEYIARYMRIIPNIIAVMLATAYILPMLAHHTAHRSVVVDKPAELCRNFGWRNLLMIQNWFKFEEMCNLHTHHIGTDFELFLISPMLLMLMWRSPRKGSLLILSLATISTILRYYVTYTKSLNYFVPFSAELSKLIATANHLYTLPTHRFTVYGIGLLLGFILIKYNDIKLKTHHVLIGNTISALAMILIVKTSVKMTGLEVIYDRNMHGLFAAFAPILACIPVAWIILASQNGHTNAVIRFLQWDGFVVTTKLCYAFYLIQIPIFQLLIANRRDIRFYSGSSLINLNEIVVICLFSIATTLLIEMPVMNIKKLVFNESTISNGSVKTLNENNNKTLNGTINKEEKVE